MPYVGHTLRLPVYKEEGIINQKSKANSRNDASAIQYHFLVSR